MIIIIDLYYFVWSCKRSINFSFTRYNNNHYSYPHRTTGHLLAINWWKKLITNIWCVTCRDLLEGVVVCCSMYFLKKETTSSWWEDIFNFFSSEVNTIVLKLYQTSWPLSLNHHEFQSTCHYFFKKLKFFLSLVDQDHVKISDSKTAYISIMN